MKKISNRRSDPEPCEIYEINRSLQIDKRRSSNASKVHLISKLNESMEYKYRTNQSSCIQ